MIASIKPLIVVEDDSFLRVIQLVLDPTAPGELVRGLRSFLRP